jgi:hypothetical protein
MNTNEHKCAAYFIFRVYLCLFVVLFGLNGNVYV